MRKLRILVHQGVQRDTTKQYYLINPCENEGFWPTQKPYKLLGKRRLLKTPEGTIRTKHYKPCPKWRLCKIQGGPDTKNLINYEEN